ncbi:MAG TPA: DUF6498-containing protein [Myxococcales bacterium]|jgi:hypothetical protein
MEASGPRLRPSEILTLVLVNAYPLVGVLWLGWSVFSLLVVYWVETALVLGCGAAKLAQEGRLGAGGGPGLPVAVTLGFMAGHYLFLYVGGIFMDEIHRSGGGITLLEPLTERPSLWTSVAFLAAGRIHSMGLLPRRPRPMLQGFDDLFANLLVPRIMIQGLVILLAFGVGVLGYQSFFLAIAALVAVKTALDLAAQAKRRKEKVEPCAS